MKKLVLFFSVFSLLVLFGCGTQVVSQKVVEEPQKCIKDYYTKLKDGNYDGAYEMLATAEKKEISKVKFKEYQVALNQVSPVVNFTVVQQTAQKDITNTSGKGINYSGAFVFTVSQNLKNQLENKEVQSSNDRYVVRDNGALKVFTYIDYKSAGSDIFADLGSIYLYGNEKGNDLNKAVTSFKKSIEWNIDNPRGYYLLGASYLGLKKYDEAIHNEKVAIEKTDDNYEKSDAYNVLGLAQQGKGKLTDAKSSFNKALELNPSNELAKNSLKGN